MAIDHEVLLSKLATRRQLIGFALLGGLLILLAIVVKSQIPIWLEELFSEIGKAFIVAAVLGWAVDSALKHDLVRNAVSAALGYLLPESLKPELNWLYDQQIIAQQIYTVRLEHFPDQGAVKVHGTYHRRIENISVETAHVRLGGGTDEWFHPMGESTIDVCEYRRIKNGETGPTTHIAINKTPIGIGYELLDVPLDKGEVIELTVSYCMWRPDHAMETLIYRYLVDRPLVTVEFPRSLHVTVSFAHRHNYEDEPNAGYISKRLERVLLPFQDIQIVWHRNSDVQERVRKHGSTEPASA
jgi:hypothetical protein